MIEIKKIESMMPDNLLRVELFLSDYCNYKCWYCTPEFWGKNYKWPELESFQENIFHLLKHYEKSGKDRFLIHIGGGEPTIWPDVINFINFMIRFLINLLNPLIFFIYFFVLFLFLNK